MSKPIRPFVLASASPRRSELLREAGYLFRTIVSGVDEPDGNLFSNPASYTLHTAWLKAQGVIGKVTSPEWILAADTAVATTSEVLGKPVDRDDARRILHLLRGTTHHVLTGVQLYLPSRCLFLSDVVTTVVHMRFVADTEVEEYLDSGEWRDKAGAYGIQLEREPFVERIEGSFTNVVGLPMERLSELFDAALLLDPAAHGG